MSTKHTSRITICIALCFVALACCRTQRQKAENAAAILQQADTAASTSLETKVAEQKPEPIVLVQAPKADTNTVLAAPQYASGEADTGKWVNIATYAPSIKQDIKYATKDNFTKKQIYDCPQCLLRPAAAEALVAAHKVLQKQGLGLKMFDCYRPGPYQQRLWDAVPDENYVAHPSKGSMHSRGVAVDLTIVDSEGKELEMGTPYDFFGPEAHTAYTNLPAQTLANRRLLKQVLEDQGFNAIKYEWWHYNYRRKEYQLSNYVWPCN